MEPSPFSDGNFGLPLVQCQPGLASMEPSPFSDGNLAVLNATALVGPLASMEPSPFSDGNTGKSWTWSTRGKCFNGAIAFQRWKRRVSVPTAQTPYRFNGAIAFQRWKPHRWGRLSRQAWLASMEPSPFSDGNIEAKVEQVVGMRASMEPSPFSDGNLAVLNATALVGPLASMEPSPFSDGNDRNEDSDHPLVNASMEPSPFSDGNC